MLRLNKNAVRPTEFIKKIQIQPMLRLNFTQNSNESFSQCDSNTTNVKVKLRTPDRRFSEFSIQIQPMLRLNYL